MWKSDIDGVGRHVPSTPVIDLTRLRDEPDYRDGAIRKGASETSIDELLAAESSRRSALGEAEQLRAKSNAASKEIGRAAPDEREGRIEAAAKIKASLAAADTSLKHAEAVVSGLILSIPNPAHVSVPSGGEQDFELIATVGAQIPPRPMDHAEFGEAMGFVDIERAVRNSGSRFAYLTGAAVRIEFALVLWIMNKLSDRGFVPVVPPVLVREEMMVDSGFFPTDRHQVYEIAGDDLFLVGTSEIPLAGLHRGERIAAEDLPLRYVGYSSCFRREAGTYGKDTRGIFRVHQFDKVEMFSYVHPDESWNELELLREIQEEILTALGLPYRVINVAAGDLGGPAAKKYDLEVWLPSEGTYRELTSCSNYTDYSARRMRTRIKVDGGSSLVHTLNGTASAIGRTLLFLFEHAQAEDGSFVVPDILRPLCGLDVVEPN